MGAEEQVALLPHGWERVDGGADGSAGSVRDASGHPRWFRPTPDAPTAAWAAGLASLPAHPFLAAVTVPEGGGGFATEDLPTSARERPPASWEELGSWAAGIADALAVLHAHDRFHGAVDVDHLRMRGDAPVLVPTGRPGGNRTGDLQALGVLLWTLTSGGAPGLGRTPRFSVPEDLCDLLGALVHPDPVGRFTSAADARNALLALQGPLVPDPLLLPDSSGARPPRPPPPEPPSAAPEGVAAGLWDAFRRVRGDGQPAVVRVSGADPGPALRAFARAIGRSGAGGIDWVGLGDQAAGLGGLQEAYESWAASPVGFVARAGGWTQDEAAAESAEFSAWLRSDRQDEDLGFRQWLRAIRGPAWRGVSVLILTGVAGAPPGAVDQILHALVPPTDRAPELSSVPVLLVVDAPVGLGEPEIPIDPPPVTPGPVVPGKRGDDLRHLVGCAGPAVPRDVVVRWAGHEWPRFLGGPGVEAWGDRVWIAADLHARWRAEAEARPDHAYLLRRVARALRQLAPRRAAAAAQSAGDTELAEALALRIAGPRTWGIAGRAASASTPSADARLGAALLAGISTRVGSLSLRALRAEHLAADCAWRGEPAKAMEWITESRATDGGGVAGLRRATWLAGLRLVTGDDVGAEAVFAEAEGLADDDELHDLWVHRARWLAGARRWDAAAAALVRAREVAGARAASAAEALMVEAEVARGTGRLEAARTALQSAAGRFVEARAWLGELRAHVQRCVVDRTGSVAVDTEWRNELWCRAAALGASDVCAEVARVDGDLARDAGDTALAARRYTEAFRWAEGQGHLESHVWSALGLARTALASGKGADATEWARRAVQGLGPWPKHAAWAPYRLLVAALLAERGDHTQTWQWLWSAQEAGLAEVLDRDTIADLERLVASSEARGWGNVLRLAGKLGVEQRSRLGDTVAAEALSERVSKAVRASR